MNEYQFYTRIKLDAGCLASDSFTYGEL